MKRLVFKILISLPLLSSGGAAIIPNPEPASSAALSAQTPTSALSLAFSTSNTTPTAKAMITAGPDLDGFTMSEKVQEKWHLTTYYSCVTFPDASVACGWHEPVLPGGTDIAAAPRPADARVAAVAAGVLALGAFFR